MKNNKDGNLATYNQFDPKYIDTVSRQHLLQMWQDFFRKIVHVLHIREDYFKKIENLLNLSQTNLRGLEIGKRKDTNQVIYFDPIFFWSFISFDEDMKLEIYDLQDILEDLYPPKQIRQNLIILLTRLF